MDERDGLLLSTEYETMNVWERFAFAGPDVRLRSSTVEGLSNNASFCIETRCSDSNGDGASTRPSSAAADNGATPALSPLGW
jgi:hypothetical protein